MKLLFLTLLALFPISILFARTPSGEALIQRGTERPGPPSIKLEFMHDLHLPSPLESGRGSFISSASGIVQRDEQLYVVADDELSLFSRTLNEVQFKPHQIFSGSLPADKDKRKAEKPDLEALTLLSPQHWPPYGALVAWPSGSTHRRMRVAVIPFAKNGRLEKAIESTMAPLAAQVQTKVKELNFEGLVVQAERVFIFQRGNSQEGLNGIVSMSLENWLRGLRKGDWSGKFAFHPVHVGTLQGVKLTFTDATWTKFGLLALASAEDTQSTYADGTVLGTVLVKIADYKAKVLAIFDPIAKFEGLTIHETSQGIELLMVEDADNPNKAGRLFRATLPASLLKNSL